jgi:hypothetical protein
MKMECYLKEVEPAMAPIFHAIWHRRAEFAVAENELGRLFEKVVPQVESAQKSGRPMDSAELETLFRKSEENNLTRRAIESQQFATAAMSGMLLHVAKQGISIVHRGINHCPPGRIIGSQALKSVIWNGRNQAHHWEE